MEPHACLEPPCVHCTDLYACPDTYVIRSRSGYSIPLKDGRGSHIGIGWCPFCGDRLDTPVDRIGKICIDLPDEEQDHLNYE